MPIFDIPDLRTKELLTIITLAERGSFVAAAAHLKTSQPALTRTVKRVERILGVLLFSRNTRRVEITPAGREFVAVAERMLNDLNLTSRSLGEIAGEQRGRITLATYSAFATQVIPPLAKCFLSTRHSVELHVAEGLQWDILEQVRDGSADFGVGLVDTVDEPFAKEPLFTESLFVAFPMGHKLSKPKRTSVALAELKGETLVTAPPDTIFRRAAETAACAAGFTFKYGVVVGRLPTIIDHVRAGVGPAIAPASVIPQKPWKDFEAYPLTDPALTLSVGIITLRGRYLSPAATALVSLIREQCRTAPHAARA
ncbi:MAG TPA: LysR family transcriptional regulator [Vicinamibacterales bacterium]